MVLLPIAIDFQESIAERICSDSLDIKECISLIDSIESFILKLDTKRKTNDIEKIINILLLAQLDLEVRLNTLLDKKRTG